jgi:cephalosporin hydroxylase
VHAESYDEMARLVAAYLSPEERLRVLDLGSYDVNGSYRPLFTQPNWTYEGADMGPGPNVDHVLQDPYRWALPEASYDVVVTGQAFEHIQFFWLTWREMARVLKPGGLIFLLAPSRGPEHRHPVDCWRFYRDGMRALGDLEGLEVLEAETRWDNPWGDTVGVFRKPGSIQAPSETAKRSAAAVPVPRATAVALSPKVRDPEYAQRYGMTLADWMIRHQEEIVFDQVTWMGVKAYKNPLDCWIYQEIVHEVRPEVIVEIGSYAGGSTLYLCHLLDMLGRGTVVSVDIDRSAFQIQHARLLEVTGDCGSPEVRDRVAGLCAGRRTMVIHDADHGRDAVLRDLRLYADLVTPGSYLIVEDGVVDVFDPNATSRLGWHRQGPMVATRLFLEEDDRFVVDLSRERYLITYNPRGFLKRVK